MEAGTTVDQFEPLITLKQAGALLQRPEKTLLNLSLKGEFPAFKVGKCWRTRKSLIDEWVKEKIESQREKSADPLRRS